MKETAVCVGGPKDGKRIEIEEGLPFFRFPMPVDLEPYELTPYFKNTNNKIKTANYRREYIADMTGKWPVYVYDEIEPGTWLKLLIDGYKK